MMRSRDPGKFSSRTLGERMTSELTKPSGFGRIHRRALREEVLEPLRAAIIFGKLAVGARLMEEELAQQLGVSRVPIREALRQLKADPRFRDIPVVVLTTSTTEDDVAYSYRSGANSFVVKPATYQAWIDLVRDLCDYWFRLVRLPRERP